jgi:hypothetical protein
MMGLRIGTFVAASAIALIAVPAFAQAQLDDVVLKKEIPGGRQRLSPRPVGESESAPLLMGVPSHANIVSTPAGFGPMPGGPLSGAMPLPAEAGK